jgi:hypothetical protein
VNGVKYRRLLGTNGGIKCSTIVFISERLYPVIKDRIDNGRNMEMKFVPAKLEAYQALVCSGSTAVSMPKGIAIIKDCNTYFKSDVINISDEAEGEPVMTFEQDAEVELKESDGYGMMLPSLAQRWSKELGLDYTVCGVNTRFAWEKGMLFCFDFLEFADRVAGTRIIKDAWGNDVDLSNVELIFTTSMVKLWDSYDSCEHYLSCCAKNKYTIGIAKTSPKTLEHERNLNYQFIQCYHLTEDQVEELIAPTIDEIHDILLLDYRKTILFLKGYGLNEDNIDSIDSDFAKALMIDKRILNDPFIRKKIFYLIKQRIQDAKIGVIKVHGNFSIVSGDPYSLCQNMFGLEVTGLLKAGEIYNAYWNEVGAKKLACFRAPMTVMSNVRAVHPCSTAEVLHWYQYMNTCTIFNSWDTAAQALNGLDKDGDLVFLTDNRVLVDNLRELPAVMCIQRNAEKKIVTEEDIIKSNIMSFGDDIGKITNKATAMYEIQSRYPADSKEFEILDYRLTSTQMFQQNAIDKAKGIIAKPMPKEWYDKAAIKSNESMSEETKELYMRIVADRKPYFMRYIYPALMKQYNNYINNTNKKALREFRLSVEELIQKDEFTEEEENFLKYYYENMPVGIGDCVMNRMCRRFEEEFDGYIGKSQKTAETFDYTIMKSGVNYSKHQYEAMLKLQDEYNQRACDFAQYKRNIRIDPYEASVVRHEMIKDFIAESANICSNEDVICDIVLDICYKKDFSKQFAWDIAGKTIIKNLLKRNNNTIYYPTLDASGDITYGGERFTFACKQLGGDNNERDFE